MKTTKYPKSTEENNMKKSVLLLVAAAIAFPLGWIQAENTSAPTEPYNLGVILPLSGNAASLGTYSRKGIELAYQNLPAEQKRNIRLYFEDDQFNSRNAVSAYQKLKAEKDIQAVFVLGSGIGRALVPITEKDELLLMAIGASDFWVVKDRRYAFLHWVTPEVEAMVLVNELKRRGYQRIAIANTEHEGARAVFDAVKAELAAQNYLDKIVLERIFLPDEKDFRTYLAKANNAKTDAMLILLFPGSIAAIARQARQLNLEADLVGIELFEDKNEVKASSGALINQWYVNVDIADDSFIKLYQKAYNEYPGWAAANAFDSLNLIAKAVVTVGTNNQKIAEFLDTLKDYTGAAGKYSATGDHRFELPATVKVVREDGFEKLHK